MNSIRNFLKHISGHFLLRNFIIAVCSILVFLYLISLALNFFTRHGQKYEVPDITGKTAQSAAPLIEEADIELVVIDSLFVAGLAPGVILDQNPEPESFVKSGRKVFIVINSVNPRSEVIPYVTGYSLRLAKNILQSRGFTINRLVYRTDMATNNVIGQTYKGKTITQDSNIEATLGEGVTLTVGRAEDAPMPLVPLVVGATLREAQSRLWEVGLNIGDIVKDKGIDNNNINEAKVYKQTPEQQSRLGYGANVTLYLSIDENRINGGKKHAEDALIEARENPAEDISEEEFNELFKEEDKD